MQYLLLVSISIVISSIGTLVGFGGGVFMVPILVIVFGVPINVAVGSVIIALLPSSIISSYFNRKHGTIDYLSGIILEVPTVIGTVLGSLLTAVVPIFISRIAFSVFIISFSSYSLFLFRTDHHLVDSRKSFFHKLNNIGPGIIRKTNYGTYRMSYAIVFVFGMLAGVGAGYFGIGGGFLKTPILLDVFNVPPHIASATALFMIIFTSLTGSASHYLLGHLHLHYSIPIIIGFSIGAFSSKIFHLKISQKFLRELIFMALLLAGLSMLIFTLFEK